MTEKSVKLIIASVALSTTMGVFVHDSHLDRATLAAMTRAEAKTDPSATSAVKIQQELHTHGEHARVTKNPGNANAPDPRDQTKNREQKKVSNKLSKTGQAAFFQPI